jgi:hypothetical protein
VPRDTLAWGLRIDQKREASPTASQGRKNTIGQSGLNSAACVSTVFLLTAFSGDKLAAHNTPNEQRPMDAALPCRKPSKKERGASATFGRGAPGATPGLSRAPGAPCHGLLFIEGQSPAPASAGP